MQSIWQQTADLPRFSPLRGEEKADVLVIGGGIAGLLCAWQLKQAGADCLLLEAGRICGGVTAGTTAKITAQHGLVYDTLLQRFGEEGACAYLEANLEALARYRSLCAEFPCDFEEKDAFVYTLHDRAALEREVQALARIGYRAEMAEELPLPFPTAGAVRFPRQGQFHPLKFLAQLAAGLRICEESPVTELRGMTAVTDHGRVKAGQIVVATHFPFLNKHGSYFLKLHQQRAYVLALEGGPQLGGMYLDGSGKGYSFRNYGGLLLLGGPSRRPGRKSGGWRELEEFSARHYPGARPAARWAAQDCMTLDGMPYVGQYSKRTPGLYVAAGFQKWGMTGSMAAASVLADLVLGRENRYAAAFSPSRSMLRPQLFLNAAEAVRGMFPPWGKRCPHMGCALRWNPQEHSWDCPCHGSRFSADGELLNNPANDDAGL